MRRLFVVAGLVLALFSAAGAGALVYFDRFVNSPLDVPAAGFAYEIRPGTPFSRVANELEAEGLVSNARLLKLYARWEGLAGSVQAGEYRIEPGTTPGKLMQQLTSGEVILYSFAIIDGWNHYELLAALQAHPQVEFDMTDEDWPAFLEALGAESQWPEGLFLPETYSFPRGTTDRAVLRQAFDLMQITLADEWSKRSDAAPVKTPYEALILASIVEKETARADERERIAGVFTRRLEKRMRLQTDPTVIYGIGPGFNGNLTRKDLQTDTPYNTYTRRGLPPTPIAMPGRAAIHAALNPADGGELYFVATGLDDGSHKFSTSKDEHDAAVREYLQRLRQKRRSN